MLKWRDAARTQVMKGFSIKVCKKLKESHVCKSTELLPSQVLVNVANKREHKSVKSHQEVCLLFQTSCPCWWRNPYISACPGIPCLAIYLKSRFFSKGYSFAFVYQYRLGGLPPTIGVVRKLSFQGRPLFTDKWFLLVPTKRRGFSGLAFRVTEQL